jgi:(4-(4-[2-(gamma-L-glutamylamino)ethyl]phenoxymethyl)furan-2-yl)methanamine synthase
LILLVEENILVSVLGLDIGGANTKAALINTQNGKLLDAKVAVEYFPVWKEQKLVNVFLILSKKLKVGQLDGLGVTMTAELSDAYATKREGVNKILASVKQVFPNNPIFVLDTNAQMIPIQAAEETPFSVAAANWVATGWLVAQKIHDCVIVDVGSTSTSIIPVLKGKVAAKGKTDLDKLLCGELVYSGSLRTNVAAIVSHVPVQGGVASVSSEIFALSADVHLILGNITEKQYICETADGREKTMPQSLSRLARVVCADAEMLTQQEIASLAKYIYNQQIQQVADALSKVLREVEAQASRKIPVVVTGLGKDFIARAAAEKNGVEMIIDLAMIIQDDAAYATPAFGVALMTASKLEGETIQWTQP